MNDDTWIYLQIKAHEAVKKWDYLSKRYLEHGTPENLKAVQDVEMQMAGYVQPLLEMVDELGYDNARAINAIFDLLTHSSWNGTDDLWAVITLSRAQNSAIGRLLDDLVDYKDEDYQSKKSPDYDPERDDPIQF